MVVVAETEQPLEQKRQLEQMTTLGGVLGLHTAKDTHNKTEVEGEAGVALKILHQLKELPISDTSSEIDFSAIAPAGSPLKVWVFDEGGVKKGAIAEKKDAQEVQISKTVKIKKTKENAFAIEGQDTLVPVNAVYLALLAKAYGVIQKQMNEGTNERLAFDGAVAHAQDEKIEKQLEIAESTKMLKELGVITHELQLIKAAQSDHAYTSAEQQTRKDVASLRRLDEIKKELAEVKKSIKPPTQKKQGESLVDSETQDLAKLNAKQTELETEKANLKTQLMGKDKDVIRRKYSDLEEKEKEVDAVTEAHRVVTTSPMPQPEALAAYAQKAFSLVYPRLIVEVDQELRQKVETLTNQGLVRAVVGRNELKYKQIKAISEMLTNANEEKEGKEMWQKVFVRMQNGELPQKDSQAIQEALENPTKENIYPAMLAVHAALGDKIDNDLSSKLQSLIEQGWGGALLLYGLDKLSKTLENIGKDSG